MFRARSPIVLLIALLAAGPLAEATCGAWCSNDSVSAACHELAPGATPRLQPTHACGAPSVAVTLPQPPGERVAHGPPYDIVPFTYASAPSGHQRRLQLGLRLIPFDRQPLSTYLRI
jgi:hypothetical protein